MRARTALLILALTAPGCYKSSVTVGDRVVVNVCPTCGRFEGTVVMVTERLAKVRFEQGGKYVNRDGGVHPGEERWVALEAIEARFVVEAAK